MIKQKYHENTQKLYAYVDENLTRCGSKASPEDRSRAYTVHKSAVRPSRPHVRRQNGERDGGREDYAINITLLGRRGGVRRTQRSGTAVSFVIFV